MISGYGDGDSAEHATHRVVDQRHALAKATEPLVLFSLLLFLLLNLFILSYLRLFDVSRDNLHHST